MNRNTAEFGQTLQKIICDRYGIEANPTAQSQFNANYNAEYALELAPICDKIEKAAGSKPVELLTFTKHLLNDKETTSPHNFLLANGKTLSIKTMMQSGKVAPTTVGQAGYAVLNRFFSDIYSKEIQTQEDLRRLVYNHIHKLLPIFIDYLFISDYTIFVNRKQLHNLIKTFPTAETI